MGDTPYTLKLFAEGDAKEVIYDQDSGGVVLDGTRLRVEYILNLLANGSTCDQITAEHAGLTDEDVASCLAVANAQLKIPFRSNSIVYKNCVEHQQIETPWIKLHPFFSYTPSVEYRLPLRFVVSETVDLLSPWLQSFVGQGPEEARSKLRNRWGEIGNEALQALRDLILNYVPASVLLHQQTSWLLLEHPRSSFSMETSADAYTAEAWRQANLFLVPAPYAKSLVDSHLDAWPFAKDNVLREFYYHFAGLKEMVPNETGCEFLLPTHSLLDELGEDYLDSTVSKDWLEAMPIYRSDCGDHLLLHPQGKLAWYFHDNNKITDSYEDFEAFLQSYLAWKAVNEYPLRPF